jgi:hypothetical protein
MNFCVGCAAVIWSNSELEGETSLEEEGKELWFLPKEYRHGILYLLT